MDKDEVSEASLLENSPLQKMVNTLPRCIQCAVAPKGKVTGDEFGTMMGALVTITAYLVTYANKDLHITPLGAFASLLGTIIGKLFNNIVTSLISTDKQVEFWNSFFKAGNSLPWIIMGAILPFVCGSFITSWRIRAIVTGIISLALKIALSYAWIKFYDIKWTRALGVVILGMIGICIAAFIPHFIKLKGV